MRTLALDIGSKRVGVAVSDPLRKTARPLVVLPRRDIEGEAACLVELIREQEVDEVVIGLPTTMRGEKGKAAVAIESVAVGLSRILDVPVRLWDERLTSAIAEASMIEAGLDRRKRKQKSDMVAAALILQQYLDSHPKTERTP